MQSDLGVYLDSDFVGTTELDSEWEDLRQILVDERDLDRIRAVSSPNDTILVEIFSEALGGFPAEMKSTPRLKYCGLFECDVRKASEHLGAIPDSVHLVLEGPGTVGFDGQAVREVKISAQGMVIGRGSAATNQPFLDLAGLPEAEGVAPIQMRIYRDQFAQWVIEDCALNGLTWVNNIVLNRERSMPWHQSRIKIGDVAFIWNCFPQQM